MAFFHGAVDRLLEAAQQGIVDGVSLGLAGRLTQNSLQRESIQFAGHFVAEAVSEVGKGLEFVRFGSRMHPAQEGDRRICATSSPGQMLGHRFVGRQHEFLDDLMAHVVLEEMGAGDSALVVVFQLRFGHVQFESAALEPTFSQDHAQLTHAQK